MNLIVVGTNHKTAPLALRERLSFSKSRLVDAASILKEKGVLKGAVILSTCNRMEIYADAQDAKIGTEELINFISRYQEIGQESFRPYLYIYQDLEAARHLAYVASGLDSQVLGERQILAQVKFAFEEALRAASIDVCLEEVFSQAISLAEKVHQQTKINEGNISIGSLAVNFIKEKLVRLAGKNILLIGLGKVNQLVLNYLKQENTNIVLASNKNFAKAKNLAKEINASVVRIDELVTYLTTADAVVSATLSPHFVIRPGMLNKKDAAHKLLILDLAIPRDVDPKVKQIPGIELFDLEDLDAVIQENVKNKISEAKKAKKIIGEELNNLWQKFTASERVEAALL